MFEYLLVVASTMIYFRVFHWSDPEPPRTDKGVQTDPWFPLQVLDFMDVSSVSSVSEATFMEWESSDSSSEIVLPPLVRQSSHGLKETRP